VADSRMKGRVKGLLGNQQPEEPYVDMSPGLPDPHAQRQALQVLTLAQKTADEHVATAQRQAEGIRAAAQAAADQVAREAHAHVEDMRRQAGNTVAEAQGRAEQIVRDAQGHADGLRREGEKNINDARAKAAEIAKDAQAAADDLDRDAQRQYDDVVGSLETKRSALAQQIEGLQQFDREYRSRLRTFMNSQLQALGPEEPTPVGAPAQRAPQAAPPEMVRVPDDGS
jgi:cell division septum initiation protein DivIVA